jgi:hypothetical protein
LSLAVLLVVSACGDVDKPAVLRKMVLPFKAAIIYNYGGPQPVAQTKFYLLARDFDRVLVEKGPISNRKGALIEPLVASLAPNGSRVGLIEEGFRSDTVATTMTDFEGNGKFENLTPGKYFVVGFTTTRKENEFVLWNVPVTVKQENQTVLLSQMNGFIGNGMYPPKIQ